MKNKLRWLVLVFVMTLVCLLPLRGDIMLDDFNASRSYPIYGGAFGTYDSFTNAVTQNGGGSLVVSAAITEGGGLYHDGLSNHLWSFYGETGLVVRAKALTNNSAGKFFVLFQDTSLRRIFFEFPFSSLNTTSFVTFNRDLTAPDFFDGGFNVQAVKSMDVHADYQDASGGTFGLELDYIQTVGSSNVYTGPTLTLARSGTNAVLKWPTNAPAGIFLQQSTNLDKLWTNYPGTPTVSGSNYTVTVPMTGQAAFFQLGSVLSTAKKFNFKSTNQTFLPDWWQTNVVPPNTDGLAPPEPAAAFGQPTIDIASYVNSYFTHLTNWTYADMHSGTIWNQHDGGTYWLQWSNASAGVTYSLTTNLGPTEAVDYTHAKFDMWGTNDATFGSQQGTILYHRQVETKLHLHAPTNNSRFTLLAASAGPIAELYNGAASEQIGYPFQPHYRTYLTNSPASSISIAGYSLDADGKIFVQVLPGQTYDVTPVLAGAANYVFNLAVATHKIVPLTWSYHQMFHRNTNNPPFVPTLFEWQYKFDQGSDLLATDNDTKIPLNDPSAAASTNESSVYRTDDVPFYVEFNLTNGPTNYCYYTRSMEPVFPQDYTSAQGTFHYGMSKYFEITSLLNLEELKYWTGATVKIVKKIIIGNTTLQGSTALAPSSIVLTEAATEFTCVHEWGHACGLFHRGSTNSAGVELNIGPISGALMAPDTATYGPKVNRFERSAMNSYSE